MQLITGVVQGLRPAIGLLLALSPGVGWGSEDCTSAADCPALHGCVRPVGSCAGQGTCELIPEACIEIYDPVCGCDDVTYSNSCFATMAGAGVSYFGECVIENDCPGGVEGNVCGEGEYCYVGVGQCGASVLGTCEDRPGGCTYDYTPVCGCDGITYANPCHAASEAANIDYEGECAQAPPELPGLSSVYAWGALAAALLGSTWILWRVRTDPHS